MFSVRFVITVYQGFLSAFISGEISELLVIVAVS
jgi:hypothetical protein